MLDQAPGEILSRGLFFGARLRVCLFVSLALHVLLLFGVQDMCLEIGGRFLSSTPKPLIEARLSDSLSVDYAKRLSHEAPPFIPGGVAVQKTHPRSEILRNKSIDSVEHSLSKSLSDYVAQPDSIRRYRIAISRMLRSHKLFAVVETYSGSTLSVRYVISKSSNTKDVSVKRLDEQVGQWGGLAALDTILGESVALVNLPSDLQNEGFSVELDIFFGEMLP